MHISFYDRKLKELTDRKLTFERVKTTYSRKIKSDKFSIIFNDKGGGDDKNLKLINSVRNDAEKYRENEGIIRDKYIHFFDLFQPPKSDAVISKIDRKSVV